MLSSSHSGSPTAELRASAKRPPQARTEADTPRCIYAVEGVSLGTASQTKGPVTAAVDGSRALNTNGSVGPADACSDDDVRLRVAAARAPRSLVVGNPAASVESSMGPLTQRGLAISQGGDPLHPSDRSSLILAVAFTLVSAALLAAPSPSELYRAGHSLLTAGGESRAEQLVETTVSEPLRSAETDPSQADPLGAPALTAAAQN